MFDETMKVKRDAFTGKVNAALGDSLKYEDFASDSEHTMHRIDTEEKVERRMLSRSL